jgi:phytoene synthase
MTPDEYCQQRAAQSGSSFYYSFLFLPPPQRRAITALYAFCREIDDAVDECGETSVARTKLAWWRTQVDAIYGAASRSGEPAAAQAAAIHESAGAPSNAMGASGVGTPEGAPQHPVAQALVPVVKTFPLARERLHEIIDGMEMDLTQRRYPDFAALKIYCHRVAGVVGLLSAEIFGYRDARTLDYAETLGLAFQLTNIIRDIGEDARRDRIYLPLDELARFGVGVGDILDARDSEAFRRLVEFQIGRALSFYREAMLALPAGDRKAQRPGLMMAAIYQTLLEEIRTDVCSVLTRRTSLTPVRKIWIAWKTWHRA